jgi:AraC-like DNA-binding protein
MAAPVGFLPSDAGQGFVRIETMGRSSAVFEQTLRDAESLIGVTLTVHDVAGVFRAPDGEPLLGARRQSHKRQAVCRRDFGARCREHCLFSVNERAARAPRPFWALCWKGVVEVVAPIRRDDVHVGTVFAGAWRHPGGRQAPQSPPLPAAVVKAWQELPRFALSQTARIGRVIHVLGRGLLAMLDESVELGAEPRTRKGVICRFLRYHAHEDVRLEDLARHLSLSASRASHVVREEFGLPWQQLLQQERIERARALLLATDLTAGQVARRVGMPNEYHFNRTFKKHVGQPPGRYRRR